MNASLRIHFPKPNKKYKRHFAASGYSKGVAEVFGLLRHGKTKRPYAGGTILSPVGKNGFWIIHFVRNDFPSGHDNSYTLEIYNADDLGKGPIQTVEGITFEEMGSRGGGAVHVTYPQGDPVGSEFAAHGTAPFSKDVSGTIGGTCTGTATEGSPGIDWVLHCLANGPHDAHGTLTVSQAGATNGTGTFVLAE